MVHVSKLTVRYITLDENKKWLYKDAEFDIGILADNINSEEMLVADKVRYIGQYFDEVFDRAFYAINEVVKFNGGHESPNIEGLNQCMACILDFKKLMVTIVAQGKRNALIFSADKTDPRNSLWKSISETASANSGVCQNLYDMVKKILSVSYTNYNG
jgi:hypothetical protein